MNNEYIKSQDGSNQQAITNRVMLGVYGWMTIALFISATTGLLLLGNESLLMLLCSGPMYFILAIAEVALVIFLSARAHKLSSTAAKLGFIAYAILNGVTFSVIFLVYNIGTISYAFLVTAITFAVMSGYGYLTKTDLTSIGNLFVMALFGLVIATVVNLFIRSDGFTLALMYIGVVIFIGLVGYDTQRIKQYALTEGRGNRNTAITGALVLYLDFINIFIRLLSIMDRDR